MKDFEFMSGIIHCKEIEEICGKLGSSEDKKKAKECAKKIRNHYKKKDNNKVWIGLLIIGLLFGVGMFMLYKRDSSGIAY